MQQRKLSDREIEAGHQAIANAIGLIHEMMQNEAGDRRQEMDKVVRALDDAGKLFRDIYPHKTFSN